MGQTDSMLDVLTVECETAVDVTLDYDTLGQKIASKDAQIARRATSTTRSAAR